MKLRGWNIKKILLGIIMGFLGRILFEQIKSAAKTKLDFVIERSCSFCHIDDICENCQPTKVHIPESTSISPAYKAKGMYEVTRWIYFDEYHIYDIINEEPKIKLNGYWKEEIHAIIQLGMEYINGNKLMGQEWTLVNLQNGYLRTDSIRGTDYILDLRVRPKLNNLTPVKTERLFRIRLVHPFMAIAEAKLISVVKDTNTDISIVIPISPNFKDFNELLENALPIIIKEKSELVLTLSSRAKHETQIAKESISKFSSLHPAAKIRVVEYAQSFNYLIGIHMGVKVVESDKVILALTEDVIFSDELLNHCRSFTIQEKRVFFPVAFAQFDPNVIEQGMPPGKPKNVNKKDHSKFIGQWAYKEHDYVCAFQSDLMNVLPETASISTTPSVGWLYDQFLFNDVEVITAVDPHLYKRYNREQCPRHKPFKYKDDRCFKKKAEFFGSKIALGILYIKEVIEKQ